MNLHLRGLALALCLLPALFPQEVPVFHADVNMVTVPFVVTDQKGVSVRDLQPGDFRLYVDGVRQDIQNLWSEPDLPLLLGVIIDVSESQGNNVTKNEAAVNQFLERIIRPRSGVRCGCKRKRHSEVGGYRRPLWTSARRVAVTRRTFKHSVRGV
jgi:hypothetical protein